MRRVTITTCLATLLVAHTALGLTQDFGSGAADDWTDVQGTWAVTDGEYVQSDLTWATTATHETYHRSYFGDQTWTDYTVEATVRIDESGGVAAILGIFFRVTEKSAGGDYYLFRLDERPAEGPGLIKAPNVTMQINPDKPAEIGRDYVLKVEVEGDSIRCYVDGVLEIETTDSDFATGAVGVGTFDAVGSFDDVSVHGVDIDAPVEARGRLPEVWARLRSAY